MPREQFLIEPEKQFVNFLNCLHQSNFAGEISPNQADRLIASTDNSIYQLLPQGVLYP